MNEQMDVWARQYADFFSHLKEPDLGRLDEFFTVDARFKDPFNDVTGLDQIAAVFRHMFRQCPAPRFYVHRWAVHGNTAFFHWRFMDRDEDAHGRMKLDVDGISRVLFNDEGKVFSHVDYWDPVEYLYDQIPLLGGLLRFVRRRIGI